MTRTVTDRRTDGQTHSRSVYRASVSSRSKTKLLILYFGVASRSMGHEVKMRPNRDHSAGVTIIPDPTQAALSAAVVVAWRVYVKIYSVEHDVYLQVALLIDF